MKLTITEKGEIQLEEVYNPIILKANSGQKMSVCMRDNGFEIEHGGCFYSIYKGKITKHEI